MNWQEQTIENIPIHRLSARIFLVSPVVQEPFSMRQSLFANSPIGRKITTLSHIAQIGGLFPGIC